MNMLHLKISRSYLIILILICFSISFQSKSLAATKVNLGTVNSFVVLGGSTVTNTGPSILNGNLGLYPGTAVTGFPPGIVNGVQHVTDAVAAQAQSDLTNAYNVAAGESCDVDLSGQDLGGLTLTTGVYCYSSSAQLTGTLTLNAQNDPDAVFIFKMGTTLTTASSSTVYLINGAQPCNVVWQVGSSATLGTGTDFKGSLLALQSVTLNTGTNVEGKILARNSAVTLDTNTINGGVCTSSSSALSLPNSSGELDTAMAIITQNKLMFAFGVFLLFVLIINMSLVLNKVRTSRK